MNLFSLALRNVTRNRQRSAVTVCAMAFAGLIMIFYAALSEGLIAATERNAIAMDLGEIQIHFPGYREDQDLYKSFEESGILKRVRDAGFAAAPRLYATGLAAAGPASAGVRIRGLDPDAEATVTRKDLHLLNGKWLDSANPGGVVLGCKLARILSAAIGDELVLVGQAADGSMANNKFRVRGILKAIGVEVDRSGVFMTVRAFRDLFALPAGIHEMALRRPPALSLDQAADKLVLMLPDLEVKTWRQLQPVLARIIDLSKYSLIATFVITYAAVGILVLNAMLMNVFERIHEFGVMKALGVSPWSVFGLVCAEAFIQVSTAAGLALAAGLPLAFYFQTHAIDLSAFAAAPATIAGVAIDPVWYCLVTRDALIMPVGFLYIIAALAISYPAAKAALIRPVRAIYHR